MDRASPFTFKPHLGALLATRMIVSDSKQALASAGSISLPLMDIGSKSFR